jgi:hypothetical protein
VRAVDAYVRDRRVRAVADAGGRRVHVESRRVGGDVTRRVRAPPAVGISAVISVGLPAPLDAR